MAQRGNRRIWTEEAGAVATSYALALTGLVIVAGVGFDVAQVAALDTELQNAADQAALAAATQLDGSANAITNATNAVKNANAASNLVNNKSLMASSGAGSAITVSAVTFYSTKADAEADTNPLNPLSASAPSAAKFVRVTLNSLRSRYALTPVGGLIASLSPDITAKATAGLGSSICKVPPVMMCNPLEATDSNFTTSNYVGKGLRLVAVGGNSFAPGNFGYIDVGGTTSGSPITDLKRALGWTSPPGDCLDVETLTTKPGANTPVTDALNTRFDIYDNGACPNGGSCPPSVNAIKDVVRSSTDNSCTIGNNQGWQLPANAYQPVSTSNSGPTPDNMGHPRDICHAVSSTGTCTNGIVGDGVWDRALYFTVNYPGFNWQTAMTSAYGTTAVTRYQVYRWEIAHSADTYTDSNTKTLTTIGASRSYTVGSGKKSTTMVVYRAPTCQPPGINPTSAGSDRRTFPVAVVNCTAAGINGRTTGVQIKKWINVFLVEPSIDRGSPKYTDKTDVYVEVIGENTVGNTTAGSEQVIRRDKPYLVK